MRTFLLFIGSILYPITMVIISPVLVFLYFLLGFVFILRHLSNIRHQALSLIANVKLPLLHLPTKKTLAFRPKAMRLH
jgi:hypothetical protein